MGEGNWHKAGTQIFTEGTPKRNLKQVNYTLSYLYMEDGP